MKSEIYKNDKVRRNGKVEERREASKVGRVRGKVQREKRGTRRK